MLEGHGDDAYRYKQPIIADFSTNVWYGGEPAGLKNYIFEHWPVINRYPEVSAESLANTISQHHSLNTNQILVGSGTTESIYLIAQAFAGQNTTIVTPAFAEYEDACRLFGHKLHFLSWEEMSNLPVLSTSLAFICNPNNPTGLVFDALEKWIALNPQTTFVVDEAFIDFTRDITSTIPLVARYPNLLVLHSLTKAYVIPGLRLGYVASTVQQITKLKQIKQPWTVNAMALLAGKFIFEHYDQIQLPLEQLLTDKKNFAETLAQNPVLKVHTSHTHFFLVETLHGNAAQLKVHLIKNHGLLIRDASNFRNLTERHFRVATLSPTHNQLLVQALAEWKNL